MSYHILQPLLVWVRLEVVHKKYVNCL